MENLIASAVDQWPQLWPVLWAILKPAIIAALIALLELLGYDKLVPSRYLRNNAAKAKSQAKTKRA